MKILFLQKDIFGRLAVMLLSAILEKEGHQCDVLINDLEKNIIKKVLDTNPDIIAFTITTGEYLWMREIGKKIREKFNKFIVCGGPHPTFYPEVINEDYLDAICIGEGEEAIVELVNNLASGKNITGIRNLVVKKDGKIYKNEIRNIIEDLDSLPFANRNIYDKYWAYYRDPYSAVSGKEIMQASRGCPFKCAFCFNEPYNELYKGKGRVFRRRSVSNIIKEIKFMKKRNPSLPFITFIDDVFTLPPKSWLNDFLNLYRKEIRIPFSIQSRMDLLDEETIKNLKVSNCVSIKLGVESANEFLRNEVLKKGITREQIFKTSYLLKKYQIKFQIFNIFGAPGETLETALETYELNRKIRPTFAWCALLNPYPGTEIYKYAVCHRFLEKELDSSRISYIFTGTPIKFKNKKEIYNLQKLFTFGVFFNLSRKIMNFLIKLPFSKLYDFIFGIGYMYGLIRIHRAKMIHSIPYIIQSAKISLVNFSKYILKPHEKSLI